MTKVVEIYTDGACKGNPGPGGWGALLRYNGTEKHLKGAESNTTNNRMELMDAIQALKALKRPCQVSLTTDSQYVRKGITEWIHGWKKKDWKNASKKAGEERRSLARAGCPQPETSGGMALGKRPQWPPRQLKRWISWPTKPLSSCCKTLLNSR